MISSIDATHPIYLSFDFKQDCLNRDLTPKTAKGYNSMVEEYLQFIPAELFNKDSTFHDFKPSLVAYKTSLKERGLCYKTIKTKFTALNNFYDYLVEDDIVSINPVPLYRRRNIREYKSPQTARTQELEKEDIETLINTAESRLWRVVIVIYALCGLRREELTDLDISCVDFDNLIFFVKLHPKRTNCRVPFSEQVLELLLDYLELRIS